MGGGQWHADRRVNVGWAPGQTLGRLQENTLAANVLAGWRHCMCVGRIARNRKDMTNGIHPRQSQQHTAFPCSA